MSEREPTRVLLIEDTAADAEVFELLLRRSGYVVEVARDATTGLERALDGDFEVVLTDLHLGGKRDEGRDVVGQLRAADPHLPVILMTGSHTADVAIDVIKLGAFDYFSKPMDVYEETFRADLMEMIDQAVTSKRLMAQVTLQGLPGADGEAAGDRIVGRSRLMQDVYKEIGRVADKPVTVLIRGETGTGKELVARAIYTYSNRAHKPFIVVNCAAIPENLLESELFGHEPGAFTGAKNRRLGRFELAHEGTIFLDEIGDMDMKLQQKLLRVLQESTIERVGGSESIPVDVRVLAATHRNLELAIEEGDFRQDLFFRLNVALISLPPLRERREDIPELVKYFIERYGPKLGCVQSPEMKEALKSAVSSFYDTQNEPLTPLATAYVETLRYLQRPDVAGHWRGNVRELRNVIRKALILAGNYPITVAIVRQAFKQVRPPRLTSGEPFAAQVAKFLARAQIGESENALQELTEVVEREVYSQAIRRAQGDQTRASRWLGVTRPTIREKLTRFRLLGVREMKGG